MRPRTLALTAWLLLAACGGDAQDERPTTQRSEAAKQRVAFFEQVRKADGAYRAGRPEEAIDLWRTALKTDPKHEASWVALARTLRELGRREEALAALTRLRDVSPELPRPYFLIAEVLAEAKDATEADLHRATDLYRKALEIEPNVSGPRLGLARVQHRLGDVEAAARSYRSVLGTNPDSRDALAELGRLLVTTGAPADAVPLLVRALEVGTRAQGRRDVPSEMDTAASFNAATLDAPHNKALLADLAKAAAALGGYPKSVPERFRR